MATPLASIAKQAPGIDEEAERRAAEARRIQLASALATADSAAAGGAKRAAQQVAPQVVQADAQGAVQGADAVRQRLQQIAQAGTTATAQQQQATQAAQRTAAAEAQSQAARATATGEADATRAQRSDFTAQETAQQERLQTLGIETDRNISFLTRQQREQLAGLGRDAKERLFDDRLQFQRDELGRKFSNELQLLDFAASSARSEQEFRDRAQTMQQAVDRELSALKIVHQSLVQSLKQGFDDQQRELDQASKERMQAAIQAMEREIARKEATAAEIGSYIKAGVGVASVIAGNPAGFAALLPSSPEVANGGMDATRPAYPGGPTPAGDPVGTDAYFAPWRSGG